MLIGVILKELKLFHLLPSNLFEMSCFAWNVNIVKNRDNVSGSGGIGDYQDKQISIKIT